MSNNPVGQLLADMAAGRAPAPDGSVDVYPQPPGPTAGVLAFTAHHVVAADVNPDWVADTVDAADVGAAMKPPFLHGLGQLLRRTAGALDVLLVSSGRSGAPPLHLVPLDGEHTRLTRAHQYRTDIRAYALEAIPQAVVLVGRGFAGRWETAFEVAPADRGRGLGRAIADAARFLVPAGEPLWAQVSPGNAASLRAVLAAGYLPVGSEVLFADAQTGS